MFKDLIKSLCGHLLDEPEEQKVKPQMVNDNAIYVLQGEADTQERIIKLRPWIEDEIREQKGDYDYTKLYWNMNKAGNFDYEVRFYKSDGAHNSAG